MTRPLPLAALTLGVLAGCGHDPSPGLFTSKARGRRLECARLSQTEAHERFPSKVPEVPPRGGVQFDHDALVCTNRFLAPDERPARDEAILSALTQSVGELASAAAALEPGPLTWHVDAFYPDAAVAQKVAVAARHALAEKGRRVSDRVPLLAAGDVMVLGRTAPQKAYAVACSRYFAHNALSEGDAFLGLMILDPREVRLHAGTCVKGAWRWLP